MAHEEEEFEIALDLADGMEDEENSGYTTPELQSSWIDR